jgi:hypothetical protein
MTLWQPKMAIIIGDSLRLCLVGLFAAAFAFKKAESQLKGYVFSWVLLERLLLRSSILKAPWGVLLSAFP